MRINERTRSSQFKTVLDVSESMTFRAPVVANAISNRKSQFFYDGAEVMEPENLILYDDLNRNIDKNHIKNLIVSISETGRIAPIIIDSNNGVTDGQHRALASAKLGYKIQVIRDEYTSEQERERVLQNFNTSSKNWTSKDFREYFRRMEVQAFAFFQEIKDRIGSGVPMDTIISVYCNQKMLFRDFKKLSIEDINGYFTEDRVKKTARINKFVSIITTLKDILNINSYIFIEAVGKHTLEIGIDDLSVVDYCERISNNQLRFQEVIPQSTGEWYVLIKECFDE